MKAKDFIIESAVSELASKLPSLSKHDHTTIDDLIRDVASNHRIHSRFLEKLFSKKYGRSPTKWFTNKLDEDNSLEHKEEVDRFVKWAAARLNIKNIPKVDLSLDTKEAQDNHHTGGHQMGGDTIWVYAKNRNLVDILRTVFHELVHVRQDELGMIEPGDSYPGSPIEAMADMLAGKYIKIYGEANHHIFQ